MARPFVAVNYAELTPPIIEAELFRCEKEPLPGRRQRGKASLKLLSVEHCLSMKSGELTVDLQPKMLKIVGSKKTKALGALNVDGLFLNSLVHKETAWFKNAPVWSSANRHR